MDLFSRFEQALPLPAFLDKHGTEVHKQRWKQVHAKIALTAQQKQLLASFTRQTKVLCLAGAWCGDCSGQCPIFEHFAAAAPVLSIRYLDRDAHADVQAALQINGGNRVPVLVFFSEDGFEVSRYGERTLSKYRQLMAQASGPSCPTGIMTASDVELLAHVTQDWLDEFERVQWVLRLSARLRQKHGD